MFWFFIFSAVNVNWQQDWFDTSSRPDTPSPLSVLVFPLLFYAHAYWAIPQLLGKKKWLLYGLSLVLIFIGPELLRLSFYALLLNRPVESELLSRDSFILGSISISWIAFMFSLVYRLLADRLITLKLKEPSGLNAGLLSTPASLISTEESKTLSETLSELMDEKQLYLSADLKLGILSAQMGITDKKLSALLNQHMNTTFTDYVNGYRIRHFIREVDNGKLQQLTVSGLMNECGFSSKATFYRAFKKIRGCTPTEWLKSKQFTEL
jgi:AraC-like DNA-binding protein